MLKTCYLYCIVITLLCSCVQKRNNLSTIADNTQFNKSYKNQEKVSPLNNIVAKKQSDDLIAKNYAHYNNKYQKELERYYKNKDYFKFLAKHDIQKIKNVEVESAPKDNMHYILEQETKNSVREINKIAMMEIEYIIFINKAIEEKERKKMQGDAIMYPFVYDKVPTNKHIVMGDEYHKFRGSCEVNGIC